MKYLIPYNEKIITDRELIDNVKHILLSVSDEDLLIIGYSKFPKTIVININGYIPKNDSHLVFDINDYIDEIERVIDYLKKHNYLFNEYVMDQVQASSGEILTYKDSRYKERKSVTDENISDIHGKSTTFTLYFKYNNLHTEG